MSAAALTVYLERLAAPPGRPTVETPSVREMAPGFLSEMRRAGLFWYLAGLIGAHLLGTALLLASWACIGAGALSGRLDAGWLAAWALALCSTIPLDAATTWLQGVLSIGFGGLLKQRLLSGAMAIDSDLVRTKGSGGLMSEVLESEAIDQLGASGGVETVLALIELLVAPALFLWGAESVPEIIVIAGWGVLSAALFAHNLRLRADWTRKRVGLSNRLVENMTAHRTRAAQQSPTRWHLADDAALDEYLMMSRRLDNGTARIEAALPRGYVIAAFAALTPAFLSGTATLADLAISLGTILFAAESFERLCLGYSQSAAAWIAWKIIRPIFDAAGRAPLAAAIDVNSEFNQRPASVLQARGVGFTHANRHQPILGGCSFSVERGDQILLEGPSGSGKSTFVSILAGSRAPSDGFVLAGGLDRQTLGDAEWRRRVALAPQYHDNHIVSGPLIFNLLMSRGYPHTANDIEEALAVCRELGLGDLLEKMPAGLNQIVGDTGWRLSQGERGRIFLARALLQKADVVVLDECLAALDPENLRQCLECVMRRAPTLIVIAHP